MSKGQLCAEKNQIMDTANVIKLLIFIVLAPRSSKSQHRDYKRNLAFRADFNATPWATTTNKGAELFSWHSLRCYRDLPFVEVKSKIRTRAINLFPPHALNFLSMTRNPYYRGSHILHGAWMYKAAAMCLYPTQTLGSLTLSWGKQFYFYNFSSYFYNLKNFPGNVIISCCLLINY